ncbi:DedA family protein [Fulvimarina sp. 2208YS6-2-32]|uniref:DedA family protein n=1 Tax=Fulvimarina uroteuthidis TaxID=3098149 RepID=A0ABU5I2D8_9HYPH|nr:DedA family protein [Fulvimarina sp. 2208YS6-2-32]MDY8109534.1 DedA family protein [Fulvimarina sp. 2208YS6-2-32]
MYEILNLISEFGPLIVLAGTFFEGEVFALIGGFLAYRGTYPFELMIGLAFVGSFFGDLAVFLFARNSSNHRWVRPWREHRRFAKALELVEKYQAYFVIVNRYIYGLRMPGLIALGMSKITLTRFLILNLIGAALWSGIFTTLGFVFGYSIQSLFSQVEVVEKGVAIFVGVLAVSLAVYFGYRQWGPIIRARRKRRKLRARRKARDEANDRLEG